eukprot:gene22698-8852_t
MLLLFSLVATVVAANDAPTIEAGPDGVIISVPDGSKVWARYGTTLEELVTKSSMEEAVAALEKRMTERLDAVEKAASDADHSTVISTLTDRVTAVEQAAMDADSSAVISKLADRVDAVETVTNNLPADQSDAIASLSEKVDASVAAADATSESVETLNSSLTILQMEVTAEGDGVVANFQKDTAANFGADAKSDMLGWSYMWNPTESVGVASGYKPLFKGTKDD